METPNYAEQGNATGGEPVPGSKPAVLLTGGSGFLGSHVAEQLVQAGFKVRALVRRTSQTEFLQTLPGVELIQGSLDDRDSLLSAVENVGAIVHCAGLVKATSEEEFFRANVDGTERLLEAARTLGGRLSRFVLVSSLAAVGPSDESGAPLPPDAPARPLTAYGRSKRAAERVVLAYRDELPVVVLRPTAIYGPRDRETLALFRAAHWRVLPVLGPARNRLTTVYAPDAARACVAALSAEIKSGSTYFVDDGETYTWMELVEAIEQAVGRRAFFRMPLPRRLVETVAFGSELFGSLTDRAMMLTRDKCRELFAQWVTDSTSTRADLGWEPRVKLAEGARLTADWYREHGWL